MSDIKNKLSLYRERSCVIANKKIEIEKMIINGRDPEDNKIKQLELQIKGLELENKKVENIVKLLPNKYYEVVNLIYLEGKGKREIAKKLDRTERQINYSINKALQRLSKNFMD